FPSVKWINGISTCEYAADFFLSHAFTFTTTFYIRDVFFHSSSLLRCCNRFYQVMFGSDYHKVNAKDGIGAGGVNADGSPLLASPGGGGNRSLFTPLLRGGWGGLNCKVYLSPTTLSNPVGLHFLHCI